MYMISHLANAIKTGSKSYSITCNYTLPRVGKYLGKHIVVDLCVVRWFPFFQQLFWLAVHCYVVLS